MACYTHAYDTWDRERRPYGEAALADIARSALTAWCSFALQESSSIIAFEQRWRDRFTNFVGLVKKWLTVVLNASHKQATLARILQKAQAVADSTWSWACDLVPIYHHLTACLERDIAGRIVTAVL